IKKLEEKRGTQKKLLLETGLTYYDVMLDDLNSITAAEKRNPIVLVAPTWKEYSIINRFGVSFFSSLLKNTTFDIIFRPHPQSYVSFPRLMDELNAFAETEPRLSVDTKPSGTESMAKSDIMISDLSGVIWDYAFLFSKPVLLLKTEFETIEGFEGSELNYPMWEMRERPKLGRIFTEEDIDSIGAIANELIGNPPSVQLEKLRDESVYNFGNAGEAAANQILGIVKRLNNVQSSN
ncbi:MAG TPA: CDP-glycerol glycerophosphotransferase family protein, partial [Tenuifilaceae bacterium]|nr:CDP-glycerol glycerophosphotransferase family protein [Tenuifilaceae bacterium]